MSNETEFVDGLVAQPPRDGAPDFVKGRLWIKRLELIAWLQVRTEDSVNVDIKESKGGKWYTSVSAFKPKDDAPKIGKRPANTHGDRDAFADESIPF